MLVRYRHSSRHGSDTGYRYPHDVPEGVLEQQYPPDELVGRDYCEPTQRGAERVPKLRRAIGCDS